MDNQIKCRCIHFDGECHNCGGEMISKPNPVIWHSDDVAYEQTKAKTAEEISLLFHTVSQNWAQCDPDAESSSGEAMANINEEAYRSFSAGYQKAYYEGQSHISNLEAKIAGFRNDFINIIERLGPTDFYNSAQVREAIEEVNEIAEEAIKEETT